ncbi:MAG: hypothetical protein CMJ49_11325 [Planctomycetaceae bacterium]|nr:hypothetical protein [Planctomycetaceae bacterium]
MAKYRGAVIGLGWMGMLYDLAARLDDRFEIEDTDRPTPALDVHRRFHHFEHPGESGIPTSYCEALVDHPDTELVAAADRDVKRLDVFKARYGLDAAYTDAAEMLNTEKPDIVAVATNTQGRADLTCLAVACGAKGIMTEKPMAHTLDEADRMVSTCAAAGAALNCGSITTTDPSFAHAKQMIREGAIGKVTSIEAPGAGAQHQNWMYFLDSDPAWVCGIGDGPRRDSGSSEFIGQGILVTGDGTVVHFRRGSPQVRISGEQGEILFNRGGLYQWELWQVVAGAAKPAPVRMPWPDPQFLAPYGGVYALKDVMDCLAGELDEPKNSGRRVAAALEVEIALKESSRQGGTQVALPLEDRSLGMHYDWFR